jgi:hypothetical protein
MLTAYGDHSSSQRLLGPHHGAAVLVGSLGADPNDAMRMSVITKITGATPAVLTVGHLGAGVSR